MSTTLAWPVILAASEKVHWRVEDLIGPDKSFDFSRPFLPESLASTRSLAFLSEAERRALNQIRAHGYLHAAGVGVRSRLALAAAARSGDRPGLAWPAP